MRAKQIIKRNLDLSKTYTLIQVGYNSLENGGAGVCMDCGKAICRYAIISDSSERFIVGLDCLKKLLKTSSFISDIDISYVEGAEYTITQFIKIHKYIETLKDNNKHLRYNGIAMMDKAYTKPFTVNKAQISVWVEFYTHFENCKPYNHSIKVGKKTDAALLEVLIKKNLLQAI